MNRATFIEELTEARRTVQQLLDQLQASEHDKFAAHLLLPSPKGIPACFRRHPGKGNKADRARQSSQASRSRRAWDSRATFAHGSTCCGFTSDACHADIAKSKMRTHELPSVTLGAYEDAMDIEKCRMAEPNEEVGVAQSSWGLSILST